MIQIAVWLSERETGGGEERERETDGWESVGGESEEGGKAEEWTVNVRSRGCYKLI